MKRIMMALVLAGTIQLTSTAASAGPNDKTFKVPGILETLHHLLDGSPAQEEPLMGYQDDEERAAPTRAQGHTGPVAPVKHPMGPDATRSKGF